MSYIPSPPLTEQHYPPFASIKKAFGFVPNFFRAQTGRTDLIEAELGFLSAAMIEDGALSRQQKEHIFLAVSARNLSTYCVTAHCEIVRMLKLEGPEPEQVALDHASARIPIADKALLNFVVKLNAEPAAVRPADIERLKTFGFTDRQIVEAIVMTGVAQFANTIAFGLGAQPDFENERVRLAMDSAGRGA